MSVNNTCFANLSSFKCNAHYQWNCFSSVSKICYFLYHSVQVIFSPITISLWNNQLFRFRSSRRSLNHNIKEACELQRCHFCILGSWHSLLYPQSVCSYIASFSNFGSSILLSYLSGFCLVMPRNLWDLSSTTRCWTLGIDSESIKS